MGGPALRTARGIQRSPDPKPLATLDPTYADTPKAAAYPEAPLFERAIPFDGDGDQVPELLALFKLIKKDGKDAKLRIEISSNPDTVGTQKGTKPATDAFECDIPAGLHPLTIPDQITVTDGYTGTMFEFDHGDFNGSKWAFTLMPPDVSGGATVYLGEVWFRGRAGR